jgi:hypothetical protein
LIAECAADPVGSLSHREREGARGFRSLVGGNPLSPTEERELTEFATQVL